MTAPHPPAPVFVCVCARLCLCARTASTFGSLGTSIVSMYYLIFCTGERAIQEKRHHARAISLLCRVRVFLITVLDIRTLSSGYTYPYYSAPRGALERRLASLAYPDNRIILERAPN